MPGLFKIKCLSFLNIIYSAFWNILYVYVCIHIYMSTHILIVLSSLSLNIKVTWPVSYLPAVSLLDWVLFLFSFFSFLPFFLPSLFESFYLKTFFITVAIGRCGPLADRHPVPPEDPRDSRPERGQAWDEQSRRGRGGVSTLPRVSVASLLGPAHWGSGPVRLRPRRARSARNAVHPWRGRHWPLAAQGSRDDGSTFVLKAPTHCRTASARPWTWGGAGAPSPSARYRPLTPRAPRDSRVCDDKLDGGRDEPLETRQDLSTLPRDPTAPDPLSRPWPAPAAPSGRAAPRASRSGTYRPQGAPRPRRRPFKGGPSAGGGKDPTYVSEGPWVYGREGRESFLKPIATFQFPRLRTLSVYWSHFRRRQAGATVGVTQALHTTEDQERFSGVL